ncbi:hypothetical protein R3P38DRAFT_2982465 [Favolaschia claudopus]|uniref:Secreted protein n=1 Tax=Favolaschia claudopus TaxID=2862362 RepID=A0AAW0B1I9_9AGAR
MEPCFCWPAFFWILGIELVTGFKIFESLDLTGPYWPIRRVSAPCCSIAVLMPQDYPNSSSSTHLALGRLVRATIYSLGKNLSCF